MSDVMRSGAKEQQKLRAQARETPREYIDRESHHIWGRRYLLSVIEADEPPRVELEHNRVKLFDLLEAHNTDHPAQAFSTGSLNYGSDLLRVPSTFARMVIDLVLQR